MTRSGLAVKDISEEFCEVFMHPSVGISSFVFPEKDDTCWICESDILCTIEHSILTSRRGGYSISQESMSKATKAHNLWEK